MKTIFRENLAESGLVQQIHIFGFPPFKPFAWQDFFAREEEWLGAHTTIHRLEAINSGFVLRFIGGLRERVARQAGCVGRIAARWWRRGIFL